MMGGLKKWGVTGAIAAGTLLMGACSAPFYGTVRVHVSDVSATSSTDIDATYSVAAGSLAGTVSEGYTAEADWTPARTVGACAFDHSSETGYGARTGTLWVDSTYHAHLATEPDATLPVTQTLGDCAVDTGVSVGFLTRMDAAIDGVGPIDVSWARRADGSYSGQRQTCRTLVGETQCTEVDVNLQPSAP